MDLNRAHETLGLSSGTSAAEVHRAYRQLCADIEARIGRASTAAIRDRYAEARAELDVARAAVLTSLESGETLDGASSAPDPWARAWAVLGLRPNAPPLDVASSYVSLCEALERDLATAPTEPLRRRALEARVEIDEAYQLCSSQPLRSGAESNAVEDAEGNAYETQVATEAFEVAPVESEETDDPELDAAAESDEGALRIEPDTADAPPPPLAAFGTSRSRRRRRRGRWLARTVAAASLALGAVLGFAWWTGTDLVQHVRRLAPDRPAPELVRSQTGAAYLRRRIAEERVELESRAEQTRARVENLELQLGASVEPEARERLEAEIAQARARRALASDLAELTETHVFSGDDLAQAYGKYEQGLELVRSGDSRRAREAFEEARAGIDFSLRELDLAEEALGARSEAVSARDAWTALSASAGLEDPEEAARGREVMAAAEALLEEGRFGAAEPELRQASQLFLAAVDDGRKALAADREARAAEVSARAEAEAEAEALALAVAQAEEAEREAEARARADRIAREKAEAARQRDVSAPPPISSIDRAAIKLAAVPAGDFLYGCNDDVDVECRDEEKPGERVALPAFHIDRTEVRISEYERCVDAGECREPDVGELCNWDQPGRGDHPVNCVDWAQAQTYCHWVGKRLPTEREWEKAARGDDGRKFPWGNEEASCARAVIIGHQGEGCGRRSTWPVASRESGRSPYGLFDMAGNVLEWTADLHGSDDGTRVLRGGSWRSVGGPVRASHRERVAPGTRSSRIGFRCAEGGSLVADSKTP